MKKPWKSVEVIWDDASSNSDAWVAQEDIATPERVNTRGWLVKDEPGYVVVASSVDEYGDPDASVGSTMTIPRGMIVSQKELRVVNARNKRTQDKLHPEPIAAEVHREQSEG